LHGVNRAQVEAQHKVVVFGAGAIGLGAVVGLRRRGVSDIVAVDISPQRLDLARQLGARATINPREQDLRAELGREHGTSSLFGWPVVNTDVFIDAAGAAEPLQQAVGMARTGARFVIVALHKHPVPLDLVQVMAKELVITGSIAYPKDEFAEVLAMLSSGAVDVRPMISHHLSFEEFPKAFATAQDTARALKVMVEFAH
jgi:(R,R)-butanediol dehydrogenase / meso-butanediol dehydrogenase / diacetyl reductase